MNKEANRNVRCHHQTLGEVADILKEENTTFTFSGASAIQLAKWLDELRVSREAIYNVRVSLANCRG